MGLTLNVAASYGSSGIRCNAICPGPTRRPADVAAAAVFPASPAAARINGVALPVDDGILAF